MAVMENCPTDCVAIVILVVPKDYSAASGAQRRQHVAVVESADSYLPDYLWRPGVDLRLLQTQ